MWRHGAGQAGRVRAGGGAAVRGGRPGRTGAETQPLTFLTLAASSSQHPHNIQQHGDMAGKQSKEAINCFTAMDKLATCASRLLRPRATPGFCSQNIEVGHSEQPHS